MATVDTNNPDVFKCNICNKNYRDRTGLWKHNKKYHELLDNRKYNHDNPIDNHIDNQNNHDKQNNQNIQDKSYLCRKCKKNFEYFQNRWRHEKKCDKTTTIVNNDLTNQISQIQKDINQLKNNKPVINKIVKNYNNGTYVNGNVVNGSNNNKITINKIGTENILELNDTEVTDIFNKEIEGVIKLIEFVNFNERLPSNHSFCTTALDSPYLSTYNTETKTVDKDRKTYFFDDLFTKAIERQEILYKNNKDKFNSTKRKQIEENIENLRAIKNSDFNNKIVKELMKKLNLLTYNKRTIVQNTWSRDKNDSDTDDEYFANLMKEDISEPDNTLTFNKLNTSDSESESEERPQLIPIKKYK